MLDSSLRSAENYKSIIEEKIKEAPKWLLSWERSLYADISQERAKTFASELYDRAKEVTDFDSVLHKLAILILTDTICAISKLNLILPTEKMKHSAWALSVWKSLHETALETKTWDLDQINKIKAETRAKVGLDLTSSYCIFLNEGFLSNGTPNEHVKCVTPIEHLKYCSLVYEFSRMGEEIFMRKDRPFEERRKESAEKLTNYLLSALKWVHPEMPAAL